MPQKTKIVDMNKEGFDFLGFRYQKFDKTKSGRKLPYMMPSKKAMKKVKDAIINEIEKIKSEGIADEDFEVSLKKLYGAHIFGYNDVDDLSGNLIDAYFGGYGLFDTVEIYKEVTKQDVEKAIAESFQKDNCCLSVIK